MGEKSKKEKSSDKERKPKKEKSEKKKDKSSKKRASDAIEPGAAPTQLSLLADDKAIDSKLSSLFDARPVIKKAAAAIAVPTTAEDTDLENDAEVEEEVIAAVDDAQDGVRPVEKTKKRKRKDDADDLEDVYLRKVAKQSDKQIEELKREKAATAQVAQTVKPLAADADSSEDEEADDMEIDTTVEQQDGAEDSDEEHYTPPQHETETAASSELDKAGRTVFVGNVSITAITSKSARRELDKHLISFFAELSKKDSDKTIAKLESLRFRSTPYSPTVPKKAAYARGEVMSTTAQSTNAYAVYSTPALAREACRHLNGTVVLDRHIRVDSVAHPAPVAHKRCVFVGNLGFVDDESNINEANEAMGHGKRKPQKPSDVEEGLWRLFGKHGTVESVRVIRDKGTRVGIGIAYVQFTDENAVESALSEDGKKSPPMLPRTLRVTRAKAMKRNKPNDKSRGGPEKSEGYRRKVTAGESTMQGRMGKLMGRAAASKASGTFRSPESFIFEGHRASSKQKSTGLKLGKTMKKPKPTGRSAKRAAAYKSGKTKKSS